MKRFAIVIVILAIIISGCAKTGDVEAQYADIYYASNSGENNSASIVPERQTIEELSVECLLEHLTTAPSDTTNFLKIIPANTTLQSWSLDDGVLSIDLSEDFGRLSGITLTRAEYCVALTLCQLSEVDSVSITVNGQKLPGAAAHLLNNQNVILTGETADPIVVETRLFFPIVGYDGLSVEYRNIALTSERIDEKASVILSELMSGPTTEESASIFCATDDARIKSVMGGLCTISLNDVTVQRFKTDFSSKELEMVLYSITDSICEVDGIDYVAFLENGNSIEEWAYSYSPNYFSR